MIIFSSCSKSKYYKLEIVDEISGERLPPSVSVTDSCGKHVEIAGKHDHVKYLGRSSWVAASVAEDPDIKNRILKEDYLFLPTQTLSVF